MHRIGSPHGSDLRTAKGTAQADADVTGQDSHPNRHGLHQCPRQLVLEDQARAVAPHYCSLGGIEPRRHRDSGGAYPLRS